MHLCYRSGVSLRNIKQLKSLWKNLKARAKTEQVRVRRSYEKTGGGPPEVTVDPMTEKIFSILPQQLKSLSNQYDDDAQFHGDSQVYMSRAKHKGSLS